MFDNPFDSFHSTVAESKQEREQLDRLLTISTPRERLLVIAVALLLFILAAWIFLGNVPRSLAVDGVLVEPADNLSGGTRSVQALIWVERAIKPQFKTGMSTVIELGMAGGEAHAIDGKVTTISAVPLSDGLAAFESVAPVTLHRIDIALDANLDFASLASRECRIVIELGKQRPIALLRMRRS